MILVNVTNLAKNCQISKFMQTSHTQKPAMSTSLVKKKSRQIAWKKLATMTIFIIFAKFSQI